MSRVPSNIVYLRIEEKDRGVVDVMAPYSNPSTLQVYAAQATSKTYVNRLADSYGPLSTQPLFLLSHSFCTM